MWLLCWVQISITNYCGAFNYLHNFQLLHDYVRFMFFLFAPKVQVIAVCVSVTSVNISVQFKLIGYDVSVFEHRTNHKRGCESDCQEPQPFLSRSFFGSCSTFTMIPNWSVFPTFTNTTFISHEVQLCR